MLPAKSANVLQRLAFVLMGLLLGLTGCGGGSSPGSGGSGGSGSGSNPPPATETGPHPPIRTRYLRTDLQYDPNALQFFPPHITAYDSVHKLSLSMLISRRVAKAPENSRIFMR